MAKSSKGTVVVRVRDGRLALCWSWSVELGGDGRRFEIAAGLSDTRANRSIAQAKAKDIERDLLNGLFDPTLKKYRGQKLADATVAELMDGFIAYKSRHLYKDTLGKYRALKTSLEQHFARKQCSKITDQDAIGFRDWLESAKGLAPETIKDKLVLAGAAWAWGISEGILQVNPWLDIKASHKVPPKQIREPFTAVELVRIIEGFRANPYYCHYTDYVIFLMGTGCRTGEASALCWRHVADDCSEVWIGESVTVNRDRKPAKNNMARRVAMTSRLQKMLLERGRGGADDPVFPSPEGLPINTRNFARRAWRTVLAEVGLQYDRPYSTRHANATISVKVHGENPEMVAQRLGHSARTLRGRYLGQVRGETPDVLGE